MRSRTRSPQPRRPAFYRSSSPASQYAGDDNAMTPTSPAKKSIFPLGLDSSMTLYFGLFAGSLTFDDIWRLRPQEKQYIKLYGKSCAIPRKQLSMGKDYKFSGQTAFAQPWHPQISALLQRTNQLLTSELNGCLINFYKGGEEYIGPHSDSEKGIVKGAPIVTISFGASRVFRVTRRKNVGVDHILRQDVILCNGDCLVMEGRMQQTHKHEILKAKDVRDSRRISVTFRQFE